MDASCWGWHGFCITEGDIAGELFALCVIVQCVKKGRVGGLALSFTA